jgi:uncharacterized protein (DUF111 family)
LPRPLTAALLREKPVRGSSAREELVTSLGALILDCLTEGCANSAGPAPALYEKRGLGYAARPPGHNDDPAGPGLILHLFTPLEQEEEPGWIMDEVEQLSCHLDHLTGEELGHALRMLDEAGALDVLWLPGLTKKNRPGGELRVLCRPEDALRLCRELFKHTHTLGLRRSRLSRLTLPRRPTVQASPWGELAAKEYDLLGENFVRAEYEAVAAAGRKAGKGLPALRFKR